MDSSGRPALIRSAQLIEDCVALGIRFVFETQSERIVVARVHGHEDGVDVFVPSKPVPMRNRAVRNEDVILLNTEAKQSMAPFTVMAAGWRA